MEYCTDFNQRIAEAINDQTNRVNALITIYNEYAEELEHGTREILMSKIELEKETLEQLYNIK